MDVGSFFSRGAPWTVPFPHLVDCCHLLVIAAHGMVRYRGAAVEGWLRACCPYLWLPRPTSLTSVVAKVWEACIGFLQRLAAASCSSLHGRRKLCEPSQHRSPLQ